MIVLDLLTTYTGHLLLTDLLTFRLINNLYGPFIVDRFANNLNQKSKCFNSNYYCPGTSYVNAFTDD